jgi:hypothetical protein
VFGSRTVQTFILSGANMGWFLRWGNWAVAKLTEVLFNTVYLSDVGCTFRVLRRDAVDRITPWFRGNGSSFGFEMMLLVAQLRLPLVQVPVKYQPRVGQSSVTGDQGAAVRLGLEMIGLCLRERCGRAPVAESVRRLRGGGTPRWRSGGRGGSRRGGPARGWRPR